MMPSYETPQDEKTIECHFVFECVTVANNINLLNFINEPFDVTHVACEDGETLELTITWNLDTTDHQANEAFKCVEYLKGLNIFADVNLVD